MKSTVGHLYVAAIAVLIFFVMWAAISAHPWASAATVDPRVADLQAREHSVRVEVARAQAAVTQKWANYNVDLKRRKVAIIRANKKRAAAIARAHSIARSSPALVVGAATAEEAVAAAEAATPVAVVAADPPAAAAAALRLPSSASGVAHRSRRAARRDPTAFPRDEHRRRDPDRRPAESRSGTPV